MTKNKLLTFFLVLNAYIFAGNLASPLFLKALPLRINDIKRNSTLVLHSSGAVMFYPLAEKKLKNSIGKGEWNLSNMVLTVSQLKKDTEEIEKYRYNVKVDENGWVTINGTEPEKVKTADSVQSLHEIFNELLPERKRIRHPGAPMPVFTIQSQD